ncbi:MAG: TetR/AcrR family transcriptional regulator [Myxococcota bacterium]|nr:TetR/AcrR family transcriptional regulator [Myxococcota bacterium]
MLDSALALVGEGGFGALSIKAVAQRADLATGTVYKHFASKAELCAEVFRLASEAELRRVQAATRGPGSAPERLGAAIGRFAERAVRGRRLAYALIAEPVDAAVDQERLRLREAYADVFATLVEEGVSEGSFREQDPSVSAAALVGVISEALVGPLAWKADDEPVVETPRLVAAIRVFCLAAVSRESA